MSVNAAFLKRLTTYCRTASPTVSSVTAVQRVSSQPIHPRPFDQQNRSMRSSTAGKPARRSAGRTSAGPPPRRTEQPLTGPDREGYLGCFWWGCCRSGNSRAVSLLRKISQDGVRLPTHPLTSRREPRSRRGVGCTRHPCRQASLRVSLRRGAGRPHPPAMGALSVIQWCAAPGPVACRRLGPVCPACASPLRSRAVTGRAGPAPALWPHGRAAKAIWAVFG